MVCFVMCKTVFCYSLLLSPNLPPQPYNPHKKMADNNSCYDNYDHFVAHAAKISIIQEITF